MIERPSGGAVFRRLPRLVRLASSFPHLPDQRIILRMGSDPEPDGGIVFEHANGAPVKADSDRIDWLTRMDSLELERRMVRGGLPAGVSPAGQSGD